MDAKDRVEWAVSHYSYRVTWSPEDGEFVGTVVEFPSLSWLAETQMEALEGLQDLLDGVIDDLQNAGEKVPVPLSERTYSGKFNLRLGEALHREVATQAAEENLSLNQWVVRQLSKGA